MQTLGIILGSNLQGKESYIQSAIVLLELNLGEVIAKSSLYASPPWGYESTNEYLNQVVLFRTILSSETVLSRNLLIEKVLGRVREDKGYTDRTIDIDILFYEDEVCETETLTLPHPRLHLRKFCLEPLYEVLPNWKHPKMRFSITELLKNCPDKSELTKRD